MGIKQTVNSKITNLYVPNSLYPQIQLGSIIKYIQNLTTSPHSLWPLSSQWSLSFSESVQLPPDWSPSSTPVPPPFQSAPSIAIGEIVLNVRSHHSCTQILWWLTLLLQVKAEVWTVASRAAQIVCLLPPPCHPSDLTHAYSPQATVDSSLLSPPAGIFLPQSLCVCCSLCLDHSYLNVHMAHSFTSVRLFSASLQIELSPNYLKIPPTYHPIPQTPYSNHCSLYQLYFSPQHLSPFGRPYVLLIFCISSVSS